MSKPSYHKLPDIIQTGNTLYNIRGTNGSGKTTVARQIMKSHPLIEKIQEGPKSVVYRHKGTAKDIFFLGSYESACGGLDAVANFEEVNRLALKYIELGDVVMEGILWSTVFKSSYELDYKLRAQGHMMIWCQLDTPIGTCIERVMNRRAEKGNMKDFDPQGMVAKQNSISRTFNKALEHNVSSMLASSDTMGDKINARICHLTVVLGAPRQFIDHTLENYKDVGVIKAPICVTPDETVNPGDMSEFFS